MNAWELARNEGIRTEVTASSPAPHTQDFIQDEAGRADADGAVGDVEGGEMPATRMKVQKIHHVAVDRAVQHIADGAAQAIGQGKRKRSRCE